MDLVEVAQATEGLGLMLADLIKGNVMSDPGRRRMVEGSAARVNLLVHDADVAVGLAFTGRQVRIGERLGDADMTITTDADTLMEMTRVPLRLGLPDPFTPEGRAIAAKLLDGRLKVSGLPKRLGLMIRLQRLFTVT
ncbi:MAG TPA: hypothetical protein VGB83_07570 [Actinomycetota bacterium]